MKSAEEKPDVVLRYLLRTDFETFARTAFETGCGEPLSNDRYLGVIFKAATDLYEGETRRLVLSMPPRHAKTLLFTVCLTAWTLAHRPSAKIMIVCYDERLARFIADKVRDVLMSSWFLATFATRIRDGHNRSMDFGTKGGGRVFANYLGSGITGHGADLIIIDDPADIADAKAPHRLLDLHTTFDAIIRNRLNHPKKGRIAIVAHRIHPDDLSGHVLRQGGWTHVKLAFIAEHDETHLTNGKKWRRRAGELLRPDEFTASDVAALRTPTAVPDFRTLYQQSPEERTWQILAEDFPFFHSVPPEAGGVVLSIDPAYVPGVRNSYSVIQAWRSDDDDHYIIDQWQQKATPADLRSALARFINRHRPKVVLLENSSAAIAAMDYLKSRAARDGFELHLISTANKSKFERFSAVVPLIKARSVHLPSAEAWSVSIVAEVTLFPRGRSDDNVDAIAQFLSWMRDRPPIECSQPRGCWRPFVIERDETVRGPAEPPRASSWLRLLPE
jgi:predicted phage terminase large subunit-like protein